MKSESPCLCSEIGLRILFSDGWKCAFCIDRDRYATPRAGTFDCVDAVLPWRFEEPLPLPPPVPPKSDLKARPAAAAIPERVTPWLLRRVKTPVTRATTQQKASADIRGSPKPPAYHHHHHAVQQQIHPSEERLEIVPQSGGNVAIAANSHPVIQRSAVQVHPHTPPKPAVAERSATPRSEAQRVPTPHSGSPQSSIRTAHEEKTRPTRAAVPLRPALSERAHLPSYHSAEPFPAPPPYRAEDSYPTSIRSRSLPRSRKHGPALGKEASLPPLPSHPPLSSSAVSRIQAGYKVSKEFGDAIMRQEVRMAIPTPIPTPGHTKLDPTTFPPLPSHPQLPNSAVSRIQAGYKVSKEFGDAIFRQEVRMAIPTPDHLDSAPTQRVGRRFMSASELQSHRKAKQRTDKSSPEQEVRQRTSSKPSSHVERRSGDSRQRAASTHSGRGHVREKR
jgi:hypothetical protein